jgi:hypothetical protein
MIRGVVVKGYSSVQETARRWGKEYASFSKSLCESNAKAEGVSRISFQQGDATHLDFPDETFDAVVSNYKKCSYWQTGLYFKPGLLSSYNPICTRK